MSQDEYARRLRMLQAVYQDECDAYSELLHPYAVARLGHADAARFADLEAHLSECAACQAVVEGLMQLESLSDTAQWIKPETIPPIPSPWATSQAHTRPPRREVMGSGIRAWIEHIQDSIQLLVELSSLSAQLPALETRSLSDHGNPLRERLLALADIEGVQDLELRLHLSPATTTPDRFDLRVEVSLPARWPDFSGVQVTLARQDHAYMTQETSPSGVVLFGGLTQAEIDAAHLRIDLAPR